MSYAERLTAFEARNKLIAKEFHAGKSVVELQSEYKLSRKRVYELIAKYSDEKA